MTHLRLWAASDRLGITGDAERFRFMCSRLWPSLRIEFVERAASQFATGASHLTRPLRPSDLLGDDLEHLMVAFGYWSPDPEAGDTAGQSRI